MVEVLPPPLTLAIMIRYLIKHNIWKLIRHRTVLGIIIILSLIVSTFGVLFFSGYFSYSYYDSIIGKTSSLSITITPTSSSQDIQSILNTITNLSGGSINSITLSDGAINNNYSDGNAIPVIGKYSKTEEEQLLLGRYFHEGENCPVVLLSETCASILGVSNMPLSETLSLADKQFEIIGILFHSDLAYILPINYYMDHYTANKIDVFFNAHLEKESLRVIQNLPGVRNAEYSEPPSPFLSAEFIPSLIQILLIYSFTFLNIILVIQLWQQSNMEQYKLYYCLGANLGTITTIASMQIIFVSLFGVLIGYLVFLLLLPTFTSCGIIYATIVDCSVLVIIISAIISLFSIIYCKKFTNGLRAFRGRS